MAKAEGGNLPFIEPSLDALVDALHRQTSSAAPVLRRFGKVAGTVLRLGEISPQEGPLEHGLTRNLVLDHNNDFQCKAVMDDQEQNVGYISVMRHEYTAELAIVETLMVPLLDENPLQEIGFMSCIAGVNAIRQYKLNERWYGIPLIENFPVFSPVLPEVSSGVVSDMESVLSKSGA